MLQLSLKHGGENVSPSLLSVYESEDQKNQSCHGLSFSEVFVYLLGALGSFIFFLLSSPCFYFHQTSCHINF